LCPRDEPMAISQVLEAEIELLELLKPIFSRGSACMMHIHTYADEINIKEIKWALEKEKDTGELVKKEAPKFTRSFAKCLVRISTKTPIPVEKVTDCPSLGRFTLRDEGKTIGIGRIMRFIPFNKDKMVRPTATAGATTTEVAEAKHAPVVFNMDSGSTEPVQAAMNSIAEEAD
jgi:sulfate adenylyltransferase subunit 1 (EFTu-like GTPase family)